MDRIEFIEGEPYCRFDGVMIKPEVYMEIFGFDGELDMLDEDTYLVNGIVYTDKKLGDLIKLFGEVHGEVEEYDAAVDTTNIVQHDPYEYEETIQVKEVTLRQEDRFLYNDLLKLDSELANVQEMSTKKGKFEMQELILERYIETIKIASVYSRLLALNVMTDKHFNPVMKSINSRIIYSIVKPTVVWFENKRENVSVSTEMVRKNKETISLWYKY